MSTFRRTRENLIEIASAYAQDRKAPINTLIKEILHFELLYAISQSPKAPSIVFQGGSALRLCYLGNRYSEDLDFAGGIGFTPDQMDGFESTLRDNIAEAYGLDVQISFKKSEDDGMSVYRWGAKIGIPQVNKALSQKHVINVEIANVPAHDPQTLLISPTYPHLSTPFRAIALRVESQNEILADKVKATVTRPFLKARDVWDIKFLQDRGAVLDYKLLAQKLVDYGWTLSRFEQAAEKTKGRLRGAEAEASFTNEMTRFLDGHIARMIDSRVASSYLNNAIATINLSTKQLIERESDGWPGMAAPRELDQN